MRQEQGICDQGLLHSYKRGVQKLRERRQRGSDHRTSSVRITELGLVVSAILSEEYCRTIFLIRIETVNKERI